MRDMSRFRETASYVRERFPLRTYLPLSLFLASGMMAGQPESRTWWALTEALLLLLVLLFPLRLLDDLSSIEEDRSRAPERLLCRTHELRFFRGVLFAGFLAAFCLLVVFFGLLNGMGYLLLFWGLHVWYVIAPGIPNRLARGLVPLLKYPLLVLLVSSGPMRGQRTWVSLVLVLAAFIIYEILHDASYEREHSWLGGSLIKHARVFRFLPFAGVMAWFGFEIAFR